MDIFTIKGIPGDVILACQKILEVIHQGAGALERREVSVKLAVPSVLTRDIADSTKDVLAGIISATRTTIHFNNDKNIRTAIDNVKNMLNDLSLLNRTDEDCETKNEVLQSRSGHQTKTKSPTSSEVTPKGSALCGIFKPKLLQYTRNKLLELRKSPNITRDVTISINEVAKDQKRNTKQDPKAKQPETRTLSTSSKSMPKPLPVRVRPGGKSSSILKSTEDILSELSLENLESLAAAFSRYDLSQTSDELRTSVMELVFCKAVESPKYATLYAKWIHLVLEHFRKCEPDVSAVKKFRETVVQVCKREFQKVVTISGGKQESQGGDSRARLRRNKFCLALFVGALYKLMAFSPKIIVDWIHVLIDMSNEEVDADSLDCLCKLLKSVGSKLELQLRCSRMLLKKTDRNGKVRDVEMDEFFAHLKTFLKKILPLQTRIRLEELIELYENNWEARESPILQSIKSGKEVRSNQNDADKNIKKEVIVEEHTKASSTDFDQGPKESPIPEVVQEVTEEEAQIQVDSSSWYNFESVSNGSLSEEIKAQDGLWESVVPFDCCWDNVQKETCSTPIGDTPSMWDWGSQTQDQQLPLTSPFSLVAPVSVWDTFEHETRRPNFFTETQSPKGQLQESPKTEFAQHQDLLSNLLSDKEAALFIFRKYYETGSQYSSCEDLIIEKFDDSSRQRTLLEVVARRACETWSKAEQVAAGKFVQLMINSTRPELGFFTLDNLLWFLANGGIMTEIKQNLCNNPRTALNLAFFVAEIVRDVPTFAEFVQLVDNSKVENCSYQFSEAIFQHIWDLFSEFLLF